MTMEKGKLYLIPSPLGDCEPAEVIPSGVLGLLPNIRRYVVEELRTVRRYLSRAGLKGHIEELDFHLLNEHSSDAEVEALLPLFDNGNDVGLISEAGLPAVADPGSRLVELCHRKGIRVVPLVGPSSLMMALMASGLNGQSFAFCGYLPAKSEERKARIRCIEKLSGQFCQSQIFIETPYRTVKDGVVDLDNSHVSYLTAEMEEGKMIAQGNAPVDENGKFINPKVKARHDADFPIVPGSEIQLMDVSPQQIASIAASLIPFLEHDDANRALMGSNMMRQAVPLMRSEAPIVGTGIEGQLVRDSRTQIMAEGEGTIEFVDATTIRIRYDRNEEQEFVSFEDAVKEYHIPKWRKTNQSTTIDLRPICSRGQRVKKGDILTEGYATENGELALGRNLKVAFMPWKGYNYEDAIVLNERMVKEDILTSVHVDEYSLEVRETKRGMEELTSDIPNVSEDATKDLDERGIIRIGAHVVPGDIMIGKITPKGESDPTPEEKLLRAIFGDKAGDVKDASLKASPSLKGVVIGTNLFSRATKTGRRNKATQALLPKLDEEYEEKLTSLKKLLVDKLMVLTDGKTSAGVQDFLGTDLIAKGAKFVPSVLMDIDYDTINLSKWTDDAHKNDLIRQTIVNYLRKSKEIDAELRRKKFDISIGDELPSGILQIAKVYIAKKRKIGVGDKMAGRHGNKGIVSRVVRQEDMPFLADGTPVDICLNPLGVPSRMNLGQIFETVLGWAGRELGEKFATPIFDGASLDDLNAWTDKAGLPRYGKTYLYDGGTGERFDQPATVGVIYMLKLGHMVEDKMLSLIHI